MYSPADTARAAQAHTGEALATRVAVIGLGYVGLPLAVALAGRFETIALERRYDMVVLAVPHREYLAEGADLRRLLVEGGTLADVRGELGEAADWRL